LKSIALTETNTTGNRSVLKVIFISPEEPRLRAGWRLLMQTMMLAIITFFIGIPFSLLSFIPGLNLPEELFLFIYQVIEILAITLSVFLARRFLDRRSFVSLGLKIDRWLMMDILSGIAITFLMMGFIFIIEWGFGWLTFDGFAWNFDDISTIIVRSLVMFITFIFVGWNEELLYRGYHLQTIASGLNAFWGVLISSMVFGVMHLGNLNATWASAVGILFAGLFLAYGYFATGRLWLPIGLHIGWNIFEGVIFGFPVSGMDFYHLTRITVTGPELWTGGGFGPEAGLVVLPGLLLGVLLIYVYTHFARNQKNGKFEIV
jgi:membrane protease YdiL (CAAX protease family)